MYFVDMSMSRTYIFIGAKTGSELFTEKSDF